MSVLKTEVDTLLLADPTNSRSTVNVFIAHPTPLEEKTFGKLYVLVEIESMDRSNQDVIASLQEELKATYYRSTEFSTETAFETALQQANTRLHDFITEGITSWFDRFNAIVAVVKNDNVIFSSVGRMHAFLFRHNKILDMSGKVGAPEEKRNPLKIFSSILNGHVQPDDRILFSTSSLFDFFSQEKLKRMIVEDLPSGTMKKIEASLTSHTTPVVFAAILYAFLAESKSGASVVPAAAVIPLRQESAPLRSMEELVAKERTTEQLLSPKLMPNVRETLRSLFAALGVFLRTKVLRRPPLRKLPHSLQSTSRFTRPSRTRAFFRLLERGLVKLLLGLLAIPRLLRSLVQRQRNVRSELQQLPVKTTGNVRRSIQWLRNLTRLQQAILVLAVIALFILSQSVISARVHQKQTLQGQSVQEAIQTIQDDVNRAAAAITYDDYSGALRLTDESTALLEKLPNRSKADKAQRSTLAQKIDEVRILTRRIRTPEFSTVAELQDVLGGSSPTGIALVGSTLVVGTNSSGKLVSVNASSGKATLIEQGAPIVRSLFPLDTQNALLIADTETVAEFSLQAKSVRSLTIQFLNADRRLAAGTTFQSRLYLLDPKNNSILRANRAGTSFGPTTQWLKDAGADVRNGIGLAVDGSIYVATNSGEMMKFQNGEKTNETFSAIDPMLKSPTSIWTNDTSKFLYVVEPAQQRIVLYNKSNRSLSGQFVGDQLKDSKGFAIDERSSTAYVLTGNAVLKFKL